MKSVATAKQSSKAKQLREIATQHIETTNKTALALDIQIGRLGKTE
jgi:hypothetical protein